MQDVNCSSEVHFRSSEIITDVRTEQVQQDD